MTAPLFFFPAGELDGAEPSSLLRLTGPEGRHAATVRRLRVGERVLLADGAGRHASTVVHALQDDGLVLSVVTVGEEPQPSPRFVLAQALAKGDRDEQAVESGTELGVDEVVPWQAARSVVVWRAERAERGRRRWEAVAYAAAKQSRRARLPVIAGAVTTAGLSELVSSAALALVLHEEAATPLATVSLPELGDVLVVVGPEGGIGADELAVLTAAGGVAVRLGDGVLRSSTAGPAALAVLSAMRRWR